MEGDDSDCNTVKVLVGQEDTEVECTIYNTRIYEGIPTLSRHGLALVALLMLGVAVLGLRRLA